MGGLDLLVAASENVVEAGGGFWRIRKVDSAAYAAAGVGRLAMLPAPAADDQRFSEEDAEALRALARKDSAAAEAAVGASRLLEIMQQALKRITPDKAKQAANQDDELLVAGVHGFSPDGTTWDDVQFVLNRKHEDKDRGRLHITRIPQAARNPLVAAIWDLTTEGGLDAERLASFRDEA